MTHSKFVTLLSALAMFGAAAAFADGTTGTSTIKAPETTIAGIGTVKANGLLQTWMTGDSNATVNSNFRLRRAEIKLSGNIEPSARWFVMADMAKAIKGTGDNRVLQDLGVAFKLYEGLELTAGQFKTPTTAEGLDSSAQLLLPERAYTARTFGDRREPGAMVSYSLNPIKVMAMISNGQGTNQDATTDTKDLNVRAEVAAMDGVKIGAFTTAGNFSYGQKARWGTNARYELNDITARIEGVHFNEAGVTGNGGSAELAYNVDNFVPVVRYERIGTQALAADSFATTLGLNYMVTGHNAKIQAAYSLLNGMSGLNGSYGIAPGTNGGLATVSFQASL